MFALKQVTPESYIISRKFVTLKWDLFLKITYIIFMLSWSWSFLFICTEKALTPYRYATQAQKFPAYLCSSTNTLVQKSTCWPLPKFEEPPIISLCLTTFSQQIFLWIKLHKNDEINLIQKLKLSTICP